MHLIVCIPHDLFVITDAVKSTVLFAAFVFFFSFRGGGGSEGILRVRVYHGRQVALRWTERHGNEIDPQMP